MSISSVYGENELVEVTFVDNSTITFYVSIPLEITVKNYNEPELDEFTVIHYSDEEISKRKQDYIQTFISQRFNMLTVDHWSY